MVRDIPHHLAHALPFRIRVGAKIIIERVEEKMTIEFITAGVRFPIPFAVGAFWPARFIHFPKRIAFTFLAVALDPAAIRIGPIAGSNGARDVSFRRRMFATLGHLLQKAQRFERFPGALLSYRIFGRCVSEAFASAVHRAPEAVVVTVLWIGAGFVSRLSQMGFGDITKWCSLDVPLDFLFVNFRFLCERHALALDAANASLGREPSAPLAIDGDL